MNIGGNKSLALFVGVDLNAIGGMEVHAKYFVDYFTRQNMLRCIVTNDFVLDCSSNGKIIYKDKLHAIQLVSTFEIDVIFFNDGHWVEEYELIRKNYPDQLMIIRSGGNEFMMAPLKNMSLPIKERRKRWSKAMNLADFIIANSEYTSRRMISIGVKKEKIILVRGGVDIKLCQELLVMKEQLHKELCERYGLDISTCLLGIVSRFEKFKGIEQTIEVLSKHQQLNWHLFLVGDGSEKEKILNMLSHSMDSSKYSFIGLLSNRDSLRIIASLDYLLNMSVEYLRESGEDTYIHTETMGRSMIEAVSCGTAIIASNVGGISELFHEHEFIGYLLNDDFDERINIILEKKVVVKGNNVEKYDWEYIFGNIYTNLMNIEICKKYMTNLVVDLEGSIVYDFLSEDDNRINFLKVLELSNNCNVIINTAGELTSIFEHYPYVSDYINQIVIIANCGKKVLVYGKNNCFWESYYESLYGPNDKLVSNVKGYIEQEGYKVAKINRVDKLYINYKVDGVNEKIIEELNDYLCDTAFKVCKNQNNVKLISKEIEKGQALRFVCHHVLKATHCIGIGNGVLDISFLNICDKAFFINQEDYNYHFEHIAIKNTRDAQLFIERILYEIKKESSYCFS